MSKLRIGVTNIEAAHDNFGNPVCLLHTEPIVLGREQALEILAHLDNGNEFTVDVVKHDQNQTKLPPQ